MSGSGDEQPRTDPSRNGAGDYRLAIRTAVLDATRFVRLSATFAPSLDPAAVRRLTIRPVELKRGRCLQFSSFDAKKDVTKNYLPEQAVERLAALCDLPFRSITVQLLDEDLVIERRQKGDGDGIRLRRLAAPAGARQQQVSHDVEKDLPLAIGRSAETDAFLRRIGVADEQGHVRPRMHAKYAQINEFLKLLEHTGELDTLHRRPLTIVDCGCGAAHLTFAVEHYLRHIRGIPVRLTGVDSNAALLARDAAMAELAGSAQVTFVSRAIIDYVPDQPPDIVLALHACDTATDEALAQAIRWRAPIILAVPCCHHHLQSQLGPNQTFRPVLRHGLLKERLADVLTDAFRAQILRDHGYATDVTQFISAEHTDRNLMIRAVRRDLAPNPALSREYRDLKEMWGVTPYLETLIGDRSPALRATPPLDRNGTKDTDSA